MTSRETDTFSLLLYLHGTFRRQITGLTHREAVRYGEAAKVDGEASRYEVWNEYHDVLDTAN